MRVLSRRSRGLQVLLAWGILLPFSARADEPAQTASQTSGAAAPASQADLEKQIQTLREEIEALKGSPGNADLAARVAELERKLDLLAQELEKMRVGEPSEETGSKGRYGFGPAASTVYGAKRGVPLAGYGDVKYQ